MRRSRRTSSQKCRYRAALPGRSPRVSRIECCGMEGAEAKDGAAATQGAPRESIKPTHINVHAYTHTHAQAQRAKQRTSGRPLRSARPMSATAVLALSLRAWKFDPTSAATTAHAAAVPRTRRETERGRACRHTHSPRYPKPTPASTHSTWQQRVSDSKGKARRRSGSSSRKSIGTVQHAERERDTERE